MLQNIARTPCFECGLGPWVESGPPLVVTVTEEVVSNDGSDI